mmetsp:Transcript_3507/g.14207  ORF Transcript_3507/g.14207 Transcript_3507/m.14207 type:complete len:234 (+) Transcript_3507:1055-1756(+)
MAPLNATRSSARSLPPAAPKSACNAATAASLMRADSAFTSPNMVEWCTAPQRYRPHNSSTTLDASRSAPESTAESSLVLATATVCAMGSTKPAAPADADTRAASVPARSSETLGVNETDVTAADAAAADAERRSRERRRAASSASGCNCCSAARLSRRRIATATSDEAPPPRRAPPPAPASSLAVAAAAADSRTLRGTNFAGAAPSVTRCFSARTPSSRGASAPSVGSSPSES